MIVSLPLCTGVLIGINTDHVFTVHARKMIPEDFGYKPSECTDTIVFIYVPGGKDMHRITGETETEPGPWSHSFITPLSIDEAYALFGVTPRQAWLKVAKSALADAT